MTLSENNFHFDEDPGREARGSSFRALTFLGRHNPLALSLALFFVILIGVTAWHFRSALFGGNARILNYDAALAETKLLANPNDVESLKKLGLYYYTWGEEISLDSLPPSLFKSTSEEEEETLFPAELKTQFASWEKLGYDTARLKNLYQEENQTEFIRLYESMKERIASNLFEKSIRYYRMAMAFEADLSREEIYYLGIAYFKLGKYYHHQAAKYLQQALDKGLTSSRAYTFLGNIAYEREDLDSAILYYRQAVDVAGRRPEPITLFNLGWVYKEKGLYDEALTEFERVQSLYADLGSERELNQEDLSILLQTRFLKGWLHLQKEQPEEAIIELSQALAAQPDSVHILYWLGKAHQAAGHKEEARRNWKTLLEIEPNYRDTRSLLNKL